MLVVGIMLVILTMILIIYIGVESNEKNNPLIFAYALVGVLIFAFFLSGLLLLQEYCNPSISPMDVYKGKTTLEITYRDSIAIDSIVVWKEGVK